MGNDVQSDILPLVEKISVLRGEKPNLTAPDQQGPNVKMAEREGFELSQSVCDSVKCQDVNDTGKELSPPIAPPSRGQLCSELEQVVQAWGTLSNELRAAILAIIGSAQSLDRCKQDRPDCGSPSGSSPQGACLDGSGGRENEPPPNLRTDETKGGA